MNKTKLSTKYWFGMPCSLRGEKYITRKKLRISKQAQLNRLELLSCPTVYITEIQQHHHLIEIQKYKEAADMYAQYHSVAISS
jgi:hypothetical protein